MNWKQPKVYAVKHKDDATRAASRSGGIFTAAFINPFPTYNIPKNNADKSTPIGVL